MPFLGEKEPLPKKDHADLLRVDLAPILAPSFMGNSMITFLTLLCGASALVAPRLQPSAFAATRLQPTAAQPPTFAQTNVVMRECGLSPALVARVRPIVACGDKPPPLKLDNTAKMQLSILLGSGLLVQMGIGMLIVVLPLFAQSRGLGSAGVGLLVALPQLTKILFNLPVGYLVDVIGRRAASANQYSFHSHRVPSHPLPCQSQEAVSHHWRID